ncbi:response regulator transcription factor [Halopseudomonas pelagia]|uniref:response regulator transcription factor n=1 Tax=Halopseudomonas pelagia TaxID=553151 RepID=UPI0003A5979E|nr:response regulator transcription factor [Halopseudomonas pelagia]|tara:strand:- start:58 stop:732 length:675 start_codon:yes stop_codon:yes gene_type:complete
MLDILLVEDDRDLAATVIQYLELEGIRCDHADNGLMALELNQRNAYDAMLLDLNLPRLDGIDVCQQLRTEGNDVPILMLTARDQLKDKLDGFRAGTDDFLIKPFELQELVVRVIALTRRRSGQIKVLQCSDLRMDLNAHEASRAGTALKLSPIGWKLLEHLLRASPAAVPRQKLEQAVWGDDVPDSNALKVHMHHLRRAIDGGIGHPLLHTVPGYGFAIKETAP